ncbi:hypothetical protein VC83_08152 [Pseudogymnoascus destructans]|uniref:Uncharacterized protein n=1 Tax=Pseudogymnoascus destructans TaxID=655981 RepID=A0A176ZZG5_9PEZI|nr:uncharacterized protein VC83_08152 [Pseudogymnoascus destructans]OAF55237.2 hypothetical protein VC83_08152 [Pseudogymnoascus destructans]
MACVSLPPLDFLAIPSAPAATTSSEPVAVPKCNFLPLLIFNTHTLQLLGQPTFMAIGVSGAIDAIRPVSGNDVTAYTTILTLKLQTFLLKPEQNSVRSAFSFVKVASHRRRKLVGGPWHHRSHLAHATSHSQRAAPQERPLKNDPSRTTPQERPLKNDPSRTTPQERPLKNDPSRTTPQERPLKNDPSRTTPQERPLKNDPSRTTPQERPLKNDPSRTTPQERPLKNDPSRTTPQERPLTLPSIAPSRAGSPEAVPARSTALWFTHAVSGGEEARIREFGSQSPTIHSTIHSTIHNLKLIPHVESTPYLAYRCCSGFTALVPPPLHQKFPRATIQLFIVHGTDSYPTRGTPRMTHSRPDHRAMAPPRFRRLSTKWNWC